MKYTIQSILESDNKLSFLFFWGHQPSKDGSIKKSCFSQWWPQEFREDGTTYPTAESYMMAKKAELFGDQKIVDEILKTTNPKEAKALGRKVKNFDEATWNQNKYSIVLRANYLKFDQNHSLKSFLLNTDEEVIVEASPYDKIWGIGMTEKDPNASIPAKWKGQNLLGFALMEVRDMIRK